MVPDNPIVLLLQKARLASTQEGLEKALTSGIFAAPRS